MTWTSPSTTATEVDAQALELEEAGPVATLAWAFSKFGDLVGVATGFGPEGLVLVDMAVRLWARPRVFFVDTGFLFPETLDLRKKLEERYQIRIDAARPALTPQDQERVFGPELWKSDPDRCCRLRKVEPLDDVLAGLAAWVTGIRRDQTPARASARAVEWDARRNVVKVNPLVKWTKSDVWRYIADNKIPYNPLHDRGYPSIGCTNCTRAVGAGEHDRAGRWSGFAKTECGIHLPGGRDDD